MRFRPCLRSIVLPTLVLASMAQQASAAVFRVGADAACQFPSVQLAIDATAANPGSDQILVASNQTYTAQALVIASQDVEIAGGYATCAAAAPTPGAKTTLSGQGGAAQSVLQITGSGGVVLRSLIITRGDKPDDGDGGGIRYEGAGLLQLEDTIVSLNRAGFGGGIHFRGNGNGEATLVIGDGTIVQNNTAARSGGGIQVSGPSTLLLMRRPDTTISGNEALGLAGDPGFGGGVQVVSPANAVIASPGFAAQGAIHGNTALRGGGLAITARSGVTETHRAVLYTTDPQRPVRVSNNRALVEGGGILLRNGNDNSGAYLCAYDFRIDGNVAPRGAAIGSTTGSIAALNIVPFGFCLVQGSPVGIGAVACAPGVRCNQVAFNRSENEFGQATNGAIIEANGGDVGGGLRARRVAMLGNTGGPLVSAGIVELESCLLADNTVFGPPLQGFPPANDLVARVEIDGCTITDNVLGDDPVVQAGAGMPLTLRRSIVHQPGKQVLAGGSPREVQFVLAHSCGNIDCNANITASVVGPRFLDPGAGDYRLHASSPAVDFAPAGGGEFDLDGQPRTRDLFRVVDRQGPRDLGAYERQATEPVVRNGGFDTDVRHWEIATPGTVAWQPSGSISDVGSVRISDEINPALAEVVGLRQCVPLPGPGPWGVFGRAFGEGLGVTRDRVLIRWRYFPTTASNNCTGTSTIGGEVLFPAGASGFADPLDVPVFVVQEADFNERTQVELTLVVVEGSTAGGSPTAGQFDAIRLVPLAAAPDELFANGFE
jgi:hypothetical protein